MSLFSILSAVLASALTWVPNDISQFWIEPDQPALFEFSADFVEGNEDFETGVKYAVKTTDGKLFYEGDGAVNNGRLEIQTTIPQGYFELELLESGQTFGIASQPAFVSDVANSSSDQRSSSRPLDRFFAIDSASTWLVRDDKTREALIRNAKRIGIATYRERLNWGRIEPQKNSFHFDGDSHSEILRKLAFKYDLPILELFHSAPDWTGRIGTFPEDLIETARSWNVIGRRWSPFWNSIEVWNEPDISFSGNLPADQYVPVLKTVAQEFQREGIETPIVGGVIAVFQNEFMNSFAQNGGLDACDIFSFHTYCRAPQMATVCLRYHDWLVKNGAAWKPVWLTECGRPWKRGTDRPNREADLESAIDVVEKGVVAKALGIDSYFPFVYVYYDENDNNFGMCDKNNAPLRSIAGYARMIYLLSGRECIGSWKVDGVDDSLLFVDSENREKTAVLYASHRQEGRSVKLPCRVAFAERITGEAVFQDESGELDFTDGFLFVRLPEGYEPELNEASAVDEARNLRREARESHGVENRRNYDLVTRFDFDPKVVSVTANGYSLVDPEVKEINTNISVFNFSTEERTLTLSAEAWSNELEIAKPIELFSQQSASANVPSRGRTTISFKTDVAKISPFYPARLTFKSDDGGVLSFNLSRGFTEENFFENVNETVRVDLSNVADWQKSCSSNGSLEFNDGLTKDGPQGWGFSVVYSGDGDKWAYPLFKLPIEDGKLTIQDDSYNLSEFRGVAFRIKGTANVDGGQLRFFTYDDRGPYYYTSAGVAPADGKERFIVVPFDRLNAYGGMPEPFLPERVQKISIGGNSKGSKMKIEVGEFFFFK